MEPAAESQTSKSQTSEPQPSEPETSKSGPGRITGPWLYAIVIFWLFSAAIGVRGLLPSSVPWIPESNAGKYNMFVASVDQQTTAQLVGPGGATLRIPVRRYFWMNPLVNTTHSDLSPTMAKRFARFVADGQKSGDCAIGFSLAEHSRHPNMRPVQCNLN